MSRVILYNSITNLLERVDPDNHLCKDISQDNRLAIATRLREPPSFLDALLFGSFCELLEVGKNAQSVLTIMGADLLAIAFGQGIQCGSPKVFARRRHSNFGAVLNQLSTLGLLASREPQAMRSRGQ